MARILLVDDDDLVRNSIARVLVKEGYELAIAQGAEEAAKIAKSDEFDLIISDIRMPGRNGVELIKDVQTYFRKERGKEIPIIFITGYPGESLNLGAEFLGEVVFKPFDLSRLLIAIREYL